MKYLLSPAVKVEFGYRIDPETISYIQRDYYLENDSIALIAYNNNDEMISNITVNVPETYLLAENQFFLNDSATAQSFKSFAQKNGYIQSIGMISNFGYKAYELTSKFEALVIK